MARSDRGDVHGAGAIETGADKALRIRDASADHFRATEYCMNHRRPSEIGIASLTCSCQRPPLSFLHTNFDPANFQRYEAGTARKVRRI